MQYFIEPRGHCLTENEEWFPDGKFMLLWAWEASVALFRARSPGVDFAQYAAVPAKEGLKKYTLYVMGPQHRYANG